MNSGKYKISKISCIGCMPVGSHERGLGIMPIIGWTYNKSYNEDNIWK